MNKPQNKDNWHLEYFKMTFKSLENFGQKKVDQGLRIHGWDEWLKDNYPTVYRKLDYASDCFNFKSVTKDYFKRACDAYYQTITWAIEKYCEEQRKNG